MELGTEPHLLRSISIAALVISHMMVIKCVTVSLILGYDLPPLTDNANAKRPIYVFII